MTEKGTGVVYQETGRRLRILNDNLSQRSLNCFVTLMGVGHEGIPEVGVREKVREADVVTLELTRGVVQAGLEKTNSQILEGNPFWRTIIDDLRDVRTQRGPMRIRGVEVNQTPRIAWKRLNLHYGIATLASSPFTFEVEPDGLTELASVLGQHEIETLKKHHWLITDNLDTLARMVDKSASALDSSSGKTRQFPFPISPGVSLVCFDAEKVRKDKDFINHKITFITPPHHSLCEALYRVFEVTDRLGFLENNEPAALAYNAMLSYLLSPSELTEAREIAYVANQFIREDAIQGQESVRVVHVGGASHTAVLSEIFNTALPKQPRIEVAATYDSKGGKMDPLGTFFRDSIFHRDRMSAVKVAGFETCVIPGLIREQVKGAIAANIDNLGARLAAHRARKY